MADEAARKAMHVLLDMVASQDLHASEEVNLLAAKTAFESFDRDAIQVTEDGETGEIAVDPTPVLTAAGMAIMSLLDQLADRLGHDRLAVLRVLREHLDGLLAE
jgi:hypothetical protein